MYACMYVRCVLHRENGLAERAERALQPHEVRQQEVCTYMYVSKYVCICMYVCMCDPVLVGQDEQVLSDRHVRQRPALRRDPEPRQGAQPTGMPTTCRYPHTYRCSCIHTYMLAHFFGAKDHALLKEYKVRVAHASSISCMMYVCMCVCMCMQVFINPSLSEVLCTTIVEVTTYIHTLHAPRYVMSPYPLPPSPPGDRDGQVGGVCGPPQQPLLPAVPQLPHVQERRCVRSFVRMHVCVIVMVIAIVMVCQRSSLRTCSGL